MKTRTMPAAAVHARADVNFACPAPAMKAWNPGIRAAVDEGDNAISILDVIGYDWWTGEGVTAKRVAAELKRIGNRDVVAYVNSPGGDYFEGLAIYNLFREHPAQVTIKILGIAASAASVIAMAGDEVQIGRAAFLMIHNCWVLTAGDRHALRSTADWMEPFDQTAVDVYAARTGLTSAKLGPLLDNETWIGGSAAVEQGFADALLGDGEARDDPKQQARAAALRAERTAENMGRLAGASRGEVRELIATLKNFKPGAEDDGTPRAAAPDEALRGLIEQMRAV